MRTSVEAFRIGLAAFIVPFMFFYSPAMLMEGDWTRILHVFVTALIGIYALSSAVQGWFFGLLPMLLRIALLVAAVLMIKGGWTTDLAGAVIALGIGIFQRTIGARRNAAAVPGGGS